WQLALLQNSVLCLSKCERLFRQQIRSGVFTYNQPDLRPPIDEVKERTNRVRPNTHGIMMLLI
ncbi:MAG TPA: hypothetical protein VL361_12370, partial [Candidatus Limnocylindrales bacterium]|nr:hypothetical protein [Candidatus Limnocylindrales bacterium]